MKLPNGTDAYVPRAKLIDYLLSETHKDGKSKARFLRKFGFDETNVSLLAYNLIEIAQHEEVAEIISNAYGTKYIVDGRVKTPNAAIIWIRTVWIIEPGLPKPRFVTAYPSEPRSQEALDD